MQNEFYCVEYLDEDDSPCYFKDKDRAFNFLRQKFLDICGDVSEEDINKALDELNEFYEIKNFGFIQVCGFED